jgi:hypothetical protein
MASNFYDDAKFGVIHRKWFGLAKKYGGDAAAGYTFGAEAATLTEAVARWYPRGSITLKKFGAMVLATVTSTATSMDRVPIFVTKNGTRVNSAIYLGVDTAPYVPYATVSTIDFTEATIPTGDYISLENGTPETADATDVVTATPAGTIAFFVDYVPTFMAQTNGADIGSWDVK